MISIYSSAFNLIKNEFDYDFFIKEFCFFADEVVIAINKSEDDTEKELKKYQNDFHNLKIVNCDFNYKDPLLDGKIKNYALQKTTQEFKIGLDLDEYIPQWQKNIWLDLCYKLRFSSFNSYMIPSVNLYKDYNFYSSVGLKWYLHKEGLFRGPVNFALKKEGTIDTSKSDTCELIDENGNLTLSQSIPNNINILRSNTVPFVVHTGYVSFEKRILRNKNFWKQHWKIESGGEEPMHKVHILTEDFCEKYEKHNLKI